MIYRIPRSLVVCLGLSMGAAGCAFAGEDEPPLDGPTQHAAQALVDLPWSPGGSSEPLFDPGLDAVQGVFANGLSAEALTRNALITNPRANPVMVDAPLATDSYADDGPYPELRRQLRHEPTREVMRYLVACALEPDQRVSYTDTSTGTTYRFRGQIGLSPHWADGPVGPKYQQLNSACLLALVNAMGSKVPLSMRGQVNEERLPRRLTPAPSVRALTYSEDGAPIASFTPCGTNRWSVSSNCGWAPEHIGSCNPGALVTIVAGGNPPGNCPADSPVGPGESALRVCGGIHGCDTTSETFLAQRRGSCGPSAEPALSFTCPRSRHFSVMRGPQSSGGATTPLHARLAAIARPPVKEVQGAREYPAPEASVFRLREGAFYGNLWGNDPLHPRFELGMNEVNEDGVFSEARVSGAVVFQRAFACTGERWTQEKAYLEARLCAGSTQNCAATPLGACDSSPSPPPCPPLHRCSVVDGPWVEGDGDFQQCIGENGAHVWDHPLTIHLNRPLDLVPLSGIMASALNETATIDPDATFGTPACQ